MKKLYLILALSVAGIAFHPDAAAQNITETYENNTWYLEKDAAIAAAAAEGKQLFICYGGMLCYSTQHVRDLLGTPNLKRIVDAGYILWYANKDDYYLFGKEVKDYFYKKVPMEDGDVIEYPLICVTDKYSDYKDSYGVVSRGKTEAMLLEYFALYTTYNISAAPQAGGTISVSANDISRAAAWEGDAITLTVRTNEGYSLSELRAYRTAEPSVDVPLTEAAPGKYTFVMPACGVTIAPTYTVNDPDYALLDQVQAVITSLGYHLFQPEANDPEAVKAWIEHQIDLMIHPADLGIVLADVTISTFAAAEASSETHPEGKSGTFTFTATLVQGAVTYTTIEISGTITAIVRRLETALLADDTLTVHIANTGNVAATGLTFALSGDDASAFTLPETATELAVAGEMDVKVTPREDLADGTYTATLTVSGESYTAPPVHITYTANSTRNHPVTSSEALTAHLRNGTLHIGGLVAGKTWAVYHLSGALLYRGIAESTSATIQLPSGKGAYIIISAERSTKVIE